MRKREGRCLSSPGKPAWMVVGLEEPWGRNGRPGDAAQVTLPAVCGWYYLILLGPKVVKAPGLGVPLLWGSNPQVSENKAKIPQVMISGDPYGCEGL